MHVGLGNPNHSGQPALGQLAVLDSPDDAVKQAPLQGLEVHVSPGLFLPEIGESWRRDVSQDETILMVSICNTYSQLSTSIMNFNRF
jgi:hypothetical protein